MKRFLLIFVFVVVLVCFMVTVDAFAVNALDDEPVADAMMGSSVITFVPKINFSKLEITVSQPDGTVFAKTFANGSSPYFDLSSIYGDTLNDGLYTYELRVSPLMVPKKRESMERAGLEKEIGLAQKSLYQTGHFLVQGGAIVTDTAPEGRSGTMDVLHYDDVIITGSFCVGFDCQDGESFGFDTIILKEHNLRIYFNDTSYTASYPTNNWRITINDSTNGGASYFSVDDVDDGTSIFKIEAGAPSNSLYVEDYGRVGLGTSTPVVELHIKDSDTPTLRLEQDSSGGWTTQTFDVAGNESNFFVRDATNGSKLPFRIQPSTPSSTLCLKSDGKVGIGTWSPGYTFEVETTGSGAQVVADRTDGATMEFSASGSYGIAGTRTDHPVKFRVNTSDVMQLNRTGNYIEMSDGGYYDGTWHGSSSRQIKENIQCLTADDALEALEGLNPIRFNYITNKEDEHVGFIAEDVPDLVATQNRKALSAMDVAAVLTKVVQEQQKTIAELKKEITELKKK